MVRPRDVAVNHLEIDRLAAVADQRLGLFGVLGSALRRPCT